MKNNDFEKYITELSPELQEKARLCKNKDELNELLAENDVELSEDALAAVAGGCSQSSFNLSTGDQTKFPCPICGFYLFYWDKTFEDGNRYYCGNSDCEACTGHYLYGFNVFKGIYPV